MLASLSFVTTSLDRGQNLLLQCSWLKFNNFCGKYVIVDGSSENQIAKFRTYQFVDYYHLPGIGPVGGAVFGMQKVDTFYSTYIGDDDIPLLKGYRKCLKFLQKNSDFDSCFAAASYVNFEKLMNLNRKSNLHWAAWFIRTVFSDRYGKSIDLSSSESLIRLKRIDATYTVTQFFVSKAEKNKIVFGNHLLKITDVHLYEYVSGFSHALLMKTATLKGMYLLRGYGSYRPNSQTENTRHVYGHDASAEAQLLKYCKSVSSSNDYIFTVYRSALSKRYIAENNRVLGVSHQMSFIQWFVQQIKRFGFVFLCQSFERFWFLKWTKSRAFLR